MNYQKETNENGNQQPQLMIIKNQKIVNILGEEESDPICDFLNCYHRFSWHDGGNKECDCHHMQNAILGVKA